MKYKTSTVQTIDELLSKYGTQEFASPYRSTIPLIELVFRNESVLEKIIPSYQNMELVFEYETPVEKGKGRASCTDLMIFNDKNSYCIEAKRTEPKYQTVEEWLSVGKENHENRLQVLQGWLYLIGKKCEMIISVSDIKEFPYQMIHRLASACKMKGKSELLYFCFSQVRENQEYYCEQLNKISKLTDGKITIKLIIFEIKETTEFIKLEEKWANRYGEMDLSEQIIQLMIENKIMDISISEIKEFPCENFIEKKEQPVFPLILTTEELHRLLVLHHYFINHTSENDSKTIQDIMDYLEDMGIKVSIQTAYRDLERLSKLAGREIKHKRNKKQFEIGDDEYEYCEQSGLYYNIFYFDTLNPFPIPVTKEQYEAIERLKDYVSLELPEDSQTEKDLKTFEDLLKRFQKN